MIQPTDGPNGRVYLVAAARTPIGRFGGGLASVPAPELGAVAIRAAMERAGLPAGAVIDDVYMGQVLQAGAGQAPARQAALAAGLSPTTPATTINRVCGSGLKAIMLGAAAIKAGDADLVVAGGMESMNGAPFLLQKARFGYRLGDGALRDEAVLDGLWCSIEDCHMGTHAERVALSKGVTRADQDAFALESHRRAVAAQDAGRFSDELVAVTVRDGRGRETVITADESPRRDTTAEALGRLRPAFAQPVPDLRDPDLPPAGPGTVTAGNAPGITDGGAATVVAVAAPPSVIPGALPAVTVPGPAGGRSGSRRSGTGCAKAGRSRPSASAVVSRRGDSSAVMTVSRPRPPRGDGARARTRPGPPASHPSRAPRAPRGCPCGSPRWNTTGRPGPLRP